MKHKILFTSACGPYPKLPVDKDPVDYFYYRNTYKQGLFQLRSFQSWHSLHFLAQNIAVDSVVLENPSVKQFQKEVNSGEYEIVAIGFTILLTQKILEMAAWVKQVKPEIEIILGGYGTAVFKENFENAEKLKKLADHICYGEGLEFLNKLIFNKWGISHQQKPRQDLLPAVNSFYRSRIPLFKQIVLVGGLGCVYACSFCATSSQFNGQYIPLFSGKALFDCLLAQTRKYPKINSAIIYEEDFLLNRPQFMEFMQHFKQSELSSRPFLLTVFASARSILKYELKEIIECGIGTIFIGVESLSDEVLQQEGLAKRKGEIENLFLQLHKHGINTLGSLVIGWDSQDSETAKADSERFVAMNPTFYQVVPLHIVPGTKLWEKMKAENRISPVYTVENDGIAAFNFESVAFPHPEALKLVFSTYSNLVKEGGPWPFRLFENLLNGYLNLKNNPDSTFSNRAQIYKKMLSPLYLLAFASRFFFFGKAYRKRWNRSMKEFCLHFPLLFSLNVLLWPVVMMVLIGIYLLANMVYHLNPRAGQPEFIRINPNAIDKFHSI